MIILPGRVIEIIFDSGQWLLEECIEERDEEIEGYKDSTSKTLGSNKRDFNNTNRIKYFDKDGFIVYSIIQEVFRYNNYGCQLSLATSNSFTPYTLYLSEGTKEISTKEISFKIDSLFISEEECRKYFNNTFRSSLPIEAVVTLLLITEDALPTMDRKKVNVLIRD